MDRILLIRSSAIGDIVFASPFVAALRRRYPAAHIAWLVEPGLDGLLAADPCIDELILWPKAEWKQLWRERRFGELFRRVRAFTKALRARKFDTAIDLQSLLKSGLLAWMSGAGRRIGLASREGSQWLMTEVLAAGGTPGRVSSEYLHLAQHLKLDTRDFFPRLFVATETEDKAGTLLATHGLHAGRYAVFAPFTTRPQKHWFEDAWLALAARVRDELGLTPVILGGPAERDAAQRMAAAMPGAVSLAGMTRLPEAAAIVAHAGLVVGVDTGLTHMGPAFNTPTVALFGSTRPYLDAGRSNSRVIWLGLPCSPCRRNPSCNARFDCLRAISPERVMHEARSVLHEAIAA
ncbi:lipopolysaccharide heptosyltransferase [Parazoarcus communis]|uniref:Lipopolysaccharide heptosyltransferase n=1 Tax=Parazoarcus communis TaxID=41977 RepID=A0A2U8H1L0_9RHOO|nr:glycosyltransferase family 9 protein [Parazoarcus communis]AWI76804.1 lipopolysaccharide heptosyltransferase [Parazoarcus communis]AWI79538.1 lipopolysaccharide heptosyltransferase [Parazoarcus communis]